MSGLRQEKSAKLKYLLGIALADDLKNRSFEEIKVTDLCEKVKISKVTFFKYFFCKEELLRYYFRVWCLELGVDLFKNPINGIEGIHYVFLKSMESLRKRPSFLPELFSYQMRDNKLRAPFPLSKMERAMFNPDPELAKVEIKSLEQLLDSFALEAILNNKISSGNPKQVTQQLYSFLLGNITHASMYKRIPSTVEVKQRVESFLESYR